METNIKDANKEIERLTGELKNMHMKTIMAITDMWESADKQDFIARLLETSVSMSHIRALAEELSKEQEEWVDRLNKQLQSQKS